MADKGKMPKKQSQQHGQPNLGQNEAQQQQRSDSDLHQMGESSRDQNKDQAKRQSDQD